MFEVMAKKDKEPDFDAESFIESVRQSSVPTYHTSNDRPAEHADNKPETVKKSRISSENDVFPDRDVELKEKYASLDLTGRETDFIRTFLESGSFRQINKLGSPIVIRDTYIEVIRKLLKLNVSNVRVAAYIDNVLLDHFRQHNSEIQGIINKCR